MTDRVQVPDKEHADLARRAEGTNLASQAGSHRNHIGLLRHQSALRLVERDGPHIAAAHVVRYMSEDAVVKSSLGINDASRILRK